MSKRLAQLALTATLAGVALTAEAGEYYLGGRFGYSNLSGGDSTFSLQPGFGAAAGYRIGPAWWVELAYTSHSNYNDTTTSGAFAFGGSKDDATQRYRAGRLGVTFIHPLIGASGPLAFSVGGGGGLMLWEINDPVEDTTLSVVGELGEERDFSASELFLSGLAGLTVRPSQSISLDLSFQIDYLTGAGNEFSDAVSSARNNLQANIWATVKFHFGAGGVVNRIDRSNLVARGEEFYRAPRKETDSDGDGVPDEKDACEQTPMGAVVDDVGCAQDSDHDGISDGLDDCPSTDARAAGLVDIYGCPVDSDFDGIPDYRDNCPANRVGAQVDSSGCPVDSDGDGVPDGLDDCPGTIFGVGVDQFGCIDLTVLDKPMVLNIDYTPGSFEIDPHSRKRLEDLARVLTFVPDIKLDITGYTDNIGTTEANQRLSEKRARRVLDYLVSQGVAEARMKAFGRGESSFVATNDTAEGRSKNRRIEIMFYK